MTGPAAFWDQRYAERDHIWSGEPNHALVATVAGLHPGRALDLGCGEGGDSLWLAARGWDVTGIDIAATAVARARRLATARAVPGDRITWLVEDLASWRPAGSFDLVSACFLQSPVDFPRAAILRRAAAAVAAGGHLLVVSHAAAPPWASGHHHDRHQFPTVAEELDDLQMDDAAWDALVGGVRLRPATGPDGQAATLEDNVIFARRRPAVGR